MQLKLLMQHVIKVRGFEAGGALRREGVEEGGGRGQSSKGAANREGSLRTASRLCKRKGDSAKERASLRRVRGGGTVANVVYCTSLLTRSTLYEGLAYLRPPPSRPFTPSPPRHNTPLLLVRSHASPSSSAASYTPFAHLRPFARPLAPPSLLHSIIPFIPFAPRSSAHSLPSFGPSPLGPSRRRFAPSPFPLRPSSRHLAPPFLPPCSSLALRYLYRPRERA
ncbi:hypothetical protein BD626DRAFT_641 [Schizophyllum amplum]|uniref:Uncharacterized protein n=1 Tax=Schizophyllum amplum TaxID=97359 RepID=A0A550CVI7_9AGAR|nr:hypothetical protein BD626DRAFT_641 [Auriculariopsis ampla]